MAGKNPHHAPVYLRVGIRGYRLLKIEQEKEVRAHVAYEARGRQSCPRCGSGQVVSKGRYLRWARHLEVFGKESRLLIQCRRLRCRECGRTFVPCLPVLLPPGCVRHQKEAGVAEFRSGRSGCGVGDYVILRPFDEKKFAASVRRAARVPRETLNFDGNRAVIYCSTTDPYQVFPP